MKTYATGAIFSFGVTIIGLGLNFLFNIYLARSLGANGFGQFSSATAIFNILCIIAVCCLDSASVKILSSNGVAIWAGIKKIGILAICNISIVCGFSLLFLDKLRSLAGGTEVPSEVLRLYIFSVPAFVAGTVLLAILQARHDLLVRMTIKYIVEPLVKFLAVGVVIYFGHGLKGLISAVNFALCVSAILAATFVVRFRDSAGTKNLNRREFSFGLILEYVLPLFFGVALTSVSSRSDVMFLGFFRSASEVGIYSAAFQVASILAIVLQCVETVIASRLSKSLQENDIDLLSFYYSSGLTLGYIIGLPLFIGFIIFDKELLSVYGGGFKDAALCLQVLSAAQFFNLATGSANAILVFSGRTGFVFINSLVVCLVQISLNYLLIPKFGILGASSAFFVSYFILNFLRVLEVYLFLRVQPFSKIVLLPTILAVIGCYFLGSFGGYQIFILSFYERCVYFFGLSVLIFGSVVLFLGVAKIKILFSESKSALRMFSKI